MSIDTLSTSQLLLSCDLALFLDEKSIICFSECSSMCFSVVYHHIGRELIFKVPVFSLIFTPPQKFLKVYKNARKFRNTLCHSPPSDILPSTITYYRGAVPRGSCSFPSLTTLALEDHYSCKNPDLKQLAPTLKSAKIYYCNSHIDLPPTLTHLWLSIDANVTIDFLPSTLTSLCSFVGFNMPISNLPISLTHLSLFNFNQKVDNLLPPNIIFLKFGCDFNQTVDNLPQNLKYLSVNQLFNQRLD